MVSGTQRPVKSVRARYLAARFPQAAEVLTLVAAAYDAAGDGTPDFAGTQALAERVRLAVGELAPEPLRSARPDTGGYYSNPDPYAPESFFARIALEAWARHAPLSVASPAPNECPRCGHAPQLGVLRPAGNGDALFLACSLCRHEWSFRRLTCPECGETDGEKIDFFSTGGLPHVQTQACRTCLAYLHLLLPERELGMVPDIDELALLAVDIWAAGQGYHKVWPNLAGM